MPCRPTVIARVVQAVFLSFLAVAATRAQEAPPGWRLVWRDEFDGDRIDEARWTPRERGGSDWDDSMTTDPRCFAIGGGTLKLIGIRNDDAAKDPSEYLTGGVTTRGKFDFNHGKIEIRARFKRARGAWPALWMLGSKGRWPNCGEIDLMEHLNFDDKAYQTIHSYCTDRLDNGRGDPPKGTTGPIARDDWNTYGAEWDAEKIVFTINGEPTMTYPKVPAKGPEQWPFDEPFYLIFSMRIEGSWVGKADPEDYPAHMEIDWVWVYEKT